MLFVAVEGANERSYRKFVASQEVGDYDSLLFISWKEDVPSPLREAFIDVKEFKFDVYSDLIHEGRRLSSMIRDDVTALFKGREELLALLMLALSHKSRRYRVSIVLDVSGLVTVKIPLRGVTTCLSDKEERVLKVLSQEGKWSVRRIASRVGFSPSTVHRVVRSLREKGLIRGYRLTEAGTLYLSLAEV